MVHSGGIIEARVVHLNGLGGHINYLEQDKKMEKKHTKKEKEIMDSHKK